jgi:hypothetical protein
MKDAEWKTPPRKARSFVGEVVWGPDRHGVVRRGRTVELLAENSKLAQVYWDGADLWEYVVASKLAPTRDEAEAKLGAREDPGTLGVRPLRGDDDAGAERDPLQDDDPYLFLGF